METSKAKWVTLLGGLLFISSLCGSKLHAQQGETSVGLRLGYPFSASIKYFVSDEHAVEGYVGFRGSSVYRWTNISVAYQVHKPLDLDFIEDLYWYFGAGGTLFIWTYDFDPFFNNEFNNTSFGIQGYLGLNYRFEEIPLELSADWIPTVFIGNGYLSGFGGGYGTLAVRYIINR